MQSGTLQQSSLDYGRVARALAYIEEHRTAQPSLAEAAQAAGLSEYHFQRLFTRWAGISPKRFLQFLTLAHVKEVLAVTADPFQAAEETGVSSLGRLHDLFVTLDAVTPAQYRDLGRGLRIRWGVHPSPFGSCLLAASQRGVTNLFFCDPADADRHVETMRQEWNLSTLVHDPRATRAYVDRIFSNVHPQRPLAVSVKGTNFQIKVWEALLKTIPGVPLSYGTLASRVGSPRAVRAVASAVAANPVSFIIPCHRVIRGMGVFGNYRWGAMQKRAIVGWEMARREVRLQE